MSSAKYPERELIPTRSRTGNGLWSMELWWHQQGERAASFMVPITTEQARALAAELLEVADKTDADNQGISDGVPA
ncbi:hypothetical protein EZI45_24765 [Delftia tsuruhatensis]|jgi:hypothetical protein|uniref:Uncharacterized protein n=1 Tax=Delftia lacustris TaxID=558537 RepID=A0A7T2YNF3_9BURK|nr:MULTISPECIES: hypothetical protein [Delftia]QPS78573.1 hypothetical protein I6G47_16185 [Delftia lacustris]QPS83596.1 hypothetical protein I6G47_11255 [Delftia lacustris]TDF23637.1 hypothetical protein EZI45_24765 [Delftia tsuruhatensis]